MYDRLLTCLWYSPPLIPSSCLIHPLLIIIMAEMAVYIYMAGNLK